MVYRKQNHRFDKLRLYYRTSYRNNRLTRKYRCTVRHCPYVTFKLKILQIFKKFLFKNSFTPKIFNIFHCKVNLFYIFNNLLNTRHYGKTAVFGNSSEKHIEIRNFILISLGKKAIHHCKLIKIREHCQIYFIFHICYLIFTPLLFVLPHALHLYYLRLYEE